MNGKRRIFVSALLAAGSLFVFAVSPSMAEEKVYKVRDVLAAMQVITKGRVIGPDENPFAINKPFVITKTSGIPGKAVTETPGLVYGKLDDTVKKIGVVMTINECVIELAGGMGINVLVAHHPFADATNFGGVRIKDYCDLYGLSLFEAHEAFHGRHPGIADIHGYKVSKVFLSYGGDHGNVVFVGQAFPEVTTLGDIIKRLNDVMQGAKYDEFLKVEREFWEKPDIQESFTSNKPAILLGTPQSRVKNVVHIFPHTGFKPEHLEQLRKDYPDTDTVVCSISRVRPDNAIVVKARELGLNFLLGNSHAQEIYENGIPLGAALQKLLPGAKIVLVEQRVTAVPIAEAGDKNLQDYGARMADVLTAK